jgi:hypothetical protein
MASRTPSRRTRSSRLAAPALANRSKQASGLSNVSASKNNETLLAKAQAVQAGSLFDQTMMSTPDMPSSTAKGKTTPASKPREAILAGNADGLGRPAPSADVDGAGDDAAVNGIMASHRSNKRKRMSRLMFGLALPSSPRRLDREEAAQDEQRRRNKLSQIQATIEKLHKSRPIWSYQPFPGDFLITISSDDTPL